MPTTFTHKKDGKCLVCVLILIHWWNQTANILYRCKIGSVGFFPLWPLLKAGLWHFEHADNLVLLQTYILYIFTQHLFRGEAKHQVRKKCKRRILQFLFLLSQVVHLWFQTYILKSVNEKFCSYLHLPSFMCGYWWWGGGRWVMLEKILLYHSKQLISVFSSLVLPIPQSKTLPVKAHFSTENLEFFCSLK